MTHLKLHSLDKVAANIDAIAALFPNAVTEVLRDGKAERAIDFDVLRQELSDGIVEGREERYQFTWPDKRKAVLAANAPITSTLRPVVTDSVGKDGTPSGFDSENLYIEGDNLEVLKLLQETYLGKVKMIYIDPPYNTGNDFVYEDDFAQSAAEYLAGSGQYDEAGNRMVTNTESNGRFHTDWLNMIYPRLKLSKDLLTEDGVIFISIDDHEQGNLRKCCDEVFGEENFVADFIWKKKSTSVNVKNALVSSLVDHILCYSRSMELCLNRRCVSAESRNHPYSDENGEYRLAIIEKKDAGDYARETMKFPILGVLPRDGKRWQIGEARARELEKNNRFVLDEGVVKLKIYKHEESDTYSANPNLLIEYGSTDSAARAVNNGLFNTPELFSNPKPIELIRHLLGMGTYKDSLVLDFFSGSATTAHAVMQLNAEDGGHRKFILVQLPEKTDEKSEAFKAGYPNICEIGKERIRRAGKKIREEAGEAAALQDFGFRCLRLDSSNMEDVYYEPEKLGQQDLFSQVDNVKEGRTAEDLLFQVMLDMGIPLSSKISERDIAGKKVFDVGDGFLLACFDSAVTEAVVTEIAKQKPQYAVLRDSSMANDSVATNFEQIFASYSPETERKVL